MPVKKKKIEFFKVNILTMEDLPSEISFAEILMIEVLQNVSLPVKGKDVELKILRNTENHIVGLLETNRDANVPPKKHRTNRTFSRIGLDVEEGLAYANVFLYDKQRNILMYESNKSGCYLDHFVDFIYSALQEAESDLFKTFLIKFEAILTHDEYNRILNFGFHKSIEVEIAKPDRIVADFDHQNNALFNAIESGRQLNSSKVFAKFEVEGRPNKGEGLATLSIRDILDNAARLMQGRNNENVKKVVVSGYEVGSKSLKKIDLVADRYFKSITLDEPRENINLLENERAQQIIQLHASCVADFERIFL
ncbi:hypothetical protein QQY79_06870 [Flavobacterium tructae]|uniref:DUF6731 family protein n=1 Tax=Flavobacterium tructae TaxID=1114873 RepID=UPI002551D782|nr:DUF6731 family protein [Flavobacterium tructae]MDL2142239.1 hypothetical protein [Flavobacterium tructae]